MVPLLFRELTYPIYKLEGPAKVRKLEGLRDVVFFDDVPPIDLLLKYREILTFERGPPSPAPERRSWPQGSTSEVILPPARQTLSPLPSPTPETF